MILLLQQNKRMMALLLLLFVSANAQANAYNLLDIENKKKAVYQMSYYSATAVKSQIKEKAAKIHSEFDRFFSPFGKRELLPRGNTIRAAIENYLYESFGKKAINQIPYTLKQEVERTEASLQRGLQRRPQGQGPPTAEEIQYYSNRIAENTQNRVKKDVGSTWDQFQREERGRGMNELGVKDTGNGLGKRDFNDMLERIRGKFKIFQLNGSARIWVPIAIQLVFCIVIFAFFFPQLTLASGIWQTVIQFTIIMPITNKLFNGYYYYNNANSGQQQSLPASSESEIGQPIPL